MITRISDRVQLSIYSTLALFQYLLANKYRLLCIFMIRSESPPFNIDLHENTWKTCILVLTKLGCVLYYNKSKANI